MADLEAKLKEAASARHRLIATDGVFSMDGYFAKLDEICDLAEKYDALVMVDDSHAVGFMGETRARHAGALRRRWAAWTSSPARWARRWAAPAAATPAGARRSSSCCASARAPISFPTPLRRRSSRHRSKVLELLTESTDLRNDCARTRAFFREGMSTAGFNILPGEHPIVPVMFGDAASPRAWRSCC